MQLLSIVIPVYNSERTIADVVKRIKITLDNIPQCSYQIILVNDGSRDSVADVCRSLALEDNRIVFLNLSKNYGQSNAIMAGFHEVKGDFVVCLDDDGQNPPEEIPKLMEAISEQDLDVVFGRSTKQQALHRNWGSWLNDYMACVMIDKPKKLKLSSFYIARRFVVEAAIQYENPYPYLIGLFLGVTSKIGNVDLEHEPRLVGRSNYTMRKLIKKWMDGLTNFSVRPLRFASMLGFVISVIAFILIGMLVVRKLINPAIQMGWTSIIAVVLFLGGIQLLALGLLGEYVGRTFLCINKRPQFFIREKITHKTD